MSPQERLANNAQLRLQFPVSSGSQHRDKEWVPVEPEPPAPKVKAVANTVDGIPAIMPSPQKPDVKVFEEPPETVSETSKDTLKQNSIELNRLWPYIS